MNIHRYLINTEGALRLLIVKQIFYHPNDNNYNTFCMTLQIK